MYRYATYNSRAKAEEALEDMFATGDVFAAEGPEIVRRDNSYSQRVTPSRYVWDILLRA